ncbi:MAG TPA: CSLREA domain-containing protein, partial [Pyrinomonadaceae bacterium]|nr:CSLREA domain-containing protein [Pyrinomonadaceae bacterium]
MQTYFNLLTTRIFIICLFLILAVLTTQAATLTVTKIADTNDGACDADCSLREAIAAANPAGGDEIVFASPLFDTPQII